MVKMIINIISKEDNSCCAAIGDIPQCTCTDFIKLSSMALGKKGKWGHYKYMYYEFKFICKVNYDNDKYIHTPTYIYNKVMKLLELASV